jgi:cystathionine gamma-synthase
MNANAAALTEFLAAHPAVDQVWYPDSTERFGRMARTGGGRGCLFSFTLPHEAAAAAFYDALHLSKGPSLGTNFSLCCPYTLLAHYTELEWAAACGVPRHLLRVSAGLEDAPDLIERFRKALAGLPE